MFLKSIPVFVIALSYTGSIGFAQVAASAKPEPRASSKFETIVAHRANHVEVDRKAPWNTYKLFKIVPAAYEPANSDHRLQPSEVEKVCRTVDNSLARALRDRSSTDDSTTNTSGLQIKPIITEVKRTNTLANVISFLAFQVTVSYGAASVRFELVDTSTGKLVGEISSRRKARPWNVYPWDFYQSFTALGQSEAILRSDARRLRKDVNRVLGLSPLQDFPATGAE